MVGVGQKLDGVYLGRLAISFMLNRKTIAELFCFGEKECLFGIFSKNTGSNAKAPKTLYFKCNNLGTVSCTRQQLLIL